MKFFNLITPAGSTPPKYSPDSLKPNGTPKTGDVEYKKTRAEEFNHVIKEYDKTLGKLKSSFLKDNFFTYGGLKEQEKFSGDPKDYKAFSENQDQVKQEKSHALDKVIDLYVNCLDHLREDLNKQKEIPDLLIKIFTNKQEDPAIRLKALHALAKSEDIDTLMNLLGSDAIDKNFGVEQIEHHVFNMPGKQQKLVALKLQDFCSSGSVSNSIEPNKNSTRAHRAINLLMEMERKGLITAKELNDACISVLKGKNVNTSLVNTALAQMKWGNLSDAQKTELRANDNVKENLTRRPKEGHYPKWPYENFEKTVMQTESKSKSVDFGAVDEIDVMITAGSHAGKLDLKLEERIKLAEANLPKEGDRFAIMEEGRRSTVNGRNRTYQGTIREPRTSFVYARIDGIDTLELTTKDGIKLNFTHDEIKKSEKLNILCDVLYREANPMPGF